MSVELKNVSKKVFSVSPHIESKDSKLLKNVTDTSLNGKSPDSQTLEPSSLGTKDFLDIKQSQEQEGFFVSSIDKDPIYDLSPEVANKNEIKKIESQVGVPFSYLSKYAAGEKYKYVVQDYYPNSIFFDVNADATGDKILVVSDDANKYDNPSIQKKDIDSIESPRGAGSVYAENAQKVWSVWIRESWTGAAANTDATKGGVFYKDDGKTVRSEQDIVDIKVLSNVTNFDFGTTQEFEQPEPRGSQTPLRFYSKNPGRTLNFTAEFYQQEYPTEPLLNIAEKAQYLCRPYRHGDYSVIPKLVEIQIPGRTFRGYLQSANVTYSSDMGDYRNWDIDKVREEINPLFSNSSKVRDGVYNGWFAQSSGGYKGMEYNSQETVYYGLGKMTISFTLLIVEEIKLYVYETYAEIEERKKIDEQQEKTDRMNYEIEREREKIRGLMEISSGFLTSPVDSYIIINPSTGQVESIVDSNGEFKYNSSSEYPEGFISLEQYNHQKELKENMSNKNSPAEGMNLLEDSSDNFVINNRDDAVDTYMIFYAKEHPELSKEEIEEERKRQMDPNTGLTTDQLLDKIRESVSNGNTEEDSYFIKSGMQKVTNKAGYIVGSFSSYGPLSKNLLSFKFENMRDLVKFYIPLVAKAPDIVFDAKEFNYTRERHIMEDIIIGAGVLEEVFDDSMFKKYGLKKKGYPLNIPCEKCTGGVSLRYKYSDIDNTTMSEESKKQCRLLCGDYDTFDTYQVSTLGIETLDNFVWVDDKGVKHTELQNFFFSLFREIQNRFTWGFYLQSLDIYKDYLTENKPPNLVYHEQGSGQPVPDYYWYEVGGL